MKGRWFINYGNVLGALLFILCCVLQNTYAQDKALEALLEQYPEAPNTELPIFTLKSKMHVGRIDFANGYTLIKQEGDWSIIRFLKPTVPLWVSEEFIEQKNNTALVTTARLNVRLSPNIDAARVTQVGLNYRSSILGSRNGFVQIKVPSNTAFLVKTDDLNGLGKSVGAERISTVEKTAAVDIREPEVKQRNEVKRVDQPVRSVIQPQIDPVSGEESHIIAPGDSISLFVFGESDLSVENLRVPESGRVSLPLIGSVAVGGQTTKQVEDKIRGILASGYVKNPRLSVSIFSYRPIFIRGAIENTGAFPFTEGLSIAKAIALAGGAKNSAKKNGISILRDGVVIQEGLSLDSQAQIASGDVITIDEELGVSEDESLFIYLHGEVANPGEYRYRRGLTVEKAIVLAGGFTLRASKKKIRITRYIDVEENEEPLKLKNVKLYTPIMPGDIISVRASLF